LISNIPNIQGNLLAASSSSDLNDQLTSSITPSSFSLPPSPPPPPSSPQNIQDIQSKNNPVLVSSDNSENQPTIDEIWDWMNDHELTFGYKIMIDVLYWNYWRPGIHNDVTLPHISGDEDSDEMEEKEDEWRDYPLKKQMDQIRQRYENHENDTINDN